MPAGLEAAILKCLQKDRRQRYADVGELAEAIAEFGPPEARFTADRIKRIVAARAPLATASSPPGRRRGARPRGRHHAGFVDRDGARPGKGGAAGEARGGPDLGSAEARGSAMRRSRRSASASVGPRSAGHRRPLGSADAPARRAAGAPRRSIAAVAAVAIGAPVMFFALRGSHGPGGRSRRPRPASTRPPSPRPGPPPSDRARRATAPSVLPGASVPPPAARGPLPGSATPPASRAPTPGRPPTRARAPTPVPTSLRRSRRSRPRTRPRRTHKGRRPLRHTEIELGPAGHLSLDPFMALRLVRLAFALAAGAGLAVLAASGRSLAQPSPDTRPPRRRSSRTGGG